MKYYKLKNAVDTKETGHVYPQTDGLVGQSTFSSENSYHKFSRLDLPDSFEPEETLKFSHSAKLSDFISNGGLLTGYGFIISEKAKKVLEQLNIVNHKFYSLPVQYRGEELSNYFWFKMFDPDNLSGVMWSESKFFAKRLSKNFGDVALNSLEDYYRKTADYEKYTYFIPEHVVIKNSKYDIFYLSFANTGVLINQRAKELFEENSLTGYELTSVDNIDFI